MKIKAMMPPLKPLRATESHSKANLSGLLRVKKWLMGPSPKSRPGTNESFPLTDNHNLQYSDYGLQ